MGSQLINVFRLCCRRTKRSGVKMFGLVSPRGDFKLKTTLNGWGGGLVVNG